MVYTTQMILKNIKAIRESKNLTQVKVAGLMGITQPHYTRFERGLIKLDIETLLEFSKVVEMTIVEIIIYPLKFESAKNAENTEESEITIKLKISNDNKVKIMDMLLMNEMVKI